MRCVSKERSRECFYRFARPADLTFPHMLEFFAREPGNLPLIGGAHLTPVPFEQQVESLSAILLDHDYYRFLHAHTRQMAGVRLVTEPALIALKARAWLDLTARKAADPGAVDSRHISKHRNDVLRLSQLLSPDDRIEAADTIRADIERFCREAFPEISEQLLGQLEAGGGRPRRPLHLPVDRLQRRLCQRIRFRAGRAPAGEAVHRQAAWTGRRKQTPPRTVQPVQWPHPHAGRKPTCLRAVLAGIARA